MADKGVKINAASVPVLRDMVRAFKNTPRAGVGGGSMSATAPRTTGPYVGKTLEQIAAGSTGQVQIYGGVKGEETEQGDPLDAHSRTTIDQDEWCLIVWIDRGYEIIPLAAGGGSSVSTDCDCTVCVAENLVTGCGSMNPMARWWHVPLLLECCAPGPLSMVLAHQSSCTWQSTQFSCDGTLCRWVLTVGSPFVELLLSLPDSKEIRFRKRLDEWSGVCTNEMTLWQPNSLPSDDCAPPCRICIEPISNFYCANCPVDGVPESWSVEFSEDAYSPFGGQTFELDDFSVDSGTPPSPGATCNWQTTYEYDDPNFTGADEFLIQFSIIGPDRPLLVLSLNGGAGSPAISFSAVRGPCGGSYELALSSAYNWPGIGSGLITNPALLPDWTVTIESQGGTIA